DAKRQALDVAMRAYDRAGQEKPQATQGSSAGGRLTHIATSIWSGLMKKRYMVGSALATLVILPAAGYVAWQVSKDYTGGRPGLSTSLEADSAANSEVMIDDKAMPLSEPTEMERPVTAQPEMAPAARPSA